MPSKAPPALRPATEQLYRVRLHSALSFTAFGFASSTVLLRAGNGIELLCDWLDLSAAVGAVAVQVVSCSCGALAAAVAQGTAIKLGLKVPHLSEAHWSLAAVRRAVLLGAVSGVVLGGFLGAWNILTDLRKVHGQRLGTAKDLKSIISTVNEGAKDVFQCERATFWALDEKHHELWTVPKEAVIATISSQECDSLIGWVVHRKLLASIADVRKDARFKEWSKQSHESEVVSVLCAPVLQEDTVVGVIELVNKQTSEGKVVAFDKDDEKVAKMIALHVAAFLEEVLTPKGS